MELAAHGIIRQFSTSYNWIPFDTKQEHPPAEIRSAWTRHVLWAICARATVHAPSLSASSCQKCTTLIQRMSSSSTLRPSRKPKLRCLLRRISSETLANCYNRQNLTLNQSLSTCSIQNREQTELHLSNKSSVNSNLLIFDHRSSRLSRLCGGCETGEDCAVVFLETFKVSDTSLPSNHMLVSFTRYTIRYPSCIAKFHLLTDLPEQIFISSRGEAYPNHTRSSVLRADRASSSPSRPDNVSIKED